MTGDITIKNDILFIGKVFFLYGKLRFFYAQTHAEKIKKWLQVYFKDSTISLKEIRISLKEILRQIIFCVSADISQCEYVG